jgi:hypothetical protein
MPADATRPPPEAMSDEELADVRVRTAQLLFELVDPIERAAMDLARGFYLAWDSETDLWDECVISGAAFGHRRVPELRQPFIQDPYVGVRLRQRLDWSQAISSSADRYTPGRTP